MNEEIKNLINEMKEVVMELHRSAGDLDDCIQSLERYLAHEKIAEDQIAFAIRLYKVKRIDHCNEHDYHKLVDKEYDIWNCLLDTTK